MSEFTIYSVLVILVSLFGLIYTYRLLQNQKNKYDTGVSERVEAHPYTLNPVFISYIIALILSVIFLAMYAFGY